MFEHHLIELRKKLALHQVDAYLISKSDEFQSEYPAQHKQKLRSFCGFTGSNGLGLVTQEQAFFFTDSRYLLQAKKELDTTWEIIEYQEKIFFDKAAHLHIGFNPLLHNLVQIQRWQKSITLIPIAEDLLPSLPIATKAAIVIHDQKYCGVAASEKIQQLMAYLKQENLNHLIITTADSISWLLNIRNPFGEYNPMVEGYLIINEDGKITLYLEDAILSDKILEYFTKLSVNVKTIQSIWSDLDALNQQTTAINSDANYQFLLTLPQARVAPNPCALLKACKNDVEIQSAIIAHIKDAVAVTEFLAWLEHQDASLYNEQQLSDKLLDFRKQQKNFMQASFPTIMGFAENGAIIHYKPNQDSAKPIKGNGLLLIDSGGQYLEGTTDITRTIVIGSATAEQIHNYTLVLKGVIALSTAIFPVGTSGRQLDSIARYHLWREGKDYGHGTGHGVGSYLCVHEGPQSISKYSSDTPLQNGMIVSIEPGYYLENQYGIRIENLAYVTPSQYQGYLCFQTLTLVPLALQLIDYYLLTKEEKLWITNYQKQIVDTIGHLLSPRALQFLKEQKC